MGMSKRACQGGRTNSGELLSSPPMVTPLLTFYTACLAGIQAIPTILMRVICAAVAHL